MNKIIFTATMAAAILFFNIFALAQETDVELEIVETMKNSAYARCERHFSARRDKQVLCINGVTLHRITREFVQCTVECKGIFSNDGERTPCFIGCNFSENKDR